MPLAHVQGNVDRNSFLASKQGLLSVWPFVWPVAHFAKENISTIPALCALQSSRSDLSPCRCQGSRGRGSFRSDGSGTGTWSHFVVLCLPLDLQIHDICVYIIYIYCILEMAMEREIYSIYIICLNVFWGIQCSRHTKHIQKYDLYTFSTADQ